MLIKALEWDTGFFRVKTGRLISESHNIDVLRRSLRRARKKGIRLLYYDIPSGNREANRMALKAGGLPVGQKVLYRKKITAETSPPNENVKVYEGPCTRRLELIALQGNSWSRFNNDRNFGKPTVAKLYRQWIRNSVSRKIADDVLVYADNGSIKAAVTVLSKRSRGHIGLFVVDKQHRCKGLGMALMKESVRYFHEKNVKTLELSTSGANIPACRFYEKNGFKKVILTNSYHFWL